VLPAVVHGGHVGQSGQAGHAGSAGQHLSVGVAEGTGAGAALGTGLQEGNLGLLEVRGKEGFS